MPHDEAMTPEFVHLFRQAAPYIHAFRHRTFVIAFGGEVVRDGKFLHLTHDLNLLASLGVRLVLVHGARPQIDALLEERNIQCEYHHYIRITDPQLLPSVKQATGQVRVEIEALLSMGLANSPMAGADIRVASGNFITARPLGVREGVDFQHTGLVRKVHAHAIQQCLQDGDMVLLSPLGYSPTGEIFNLTVEDVATSTAIALNADKLLFLTNLKGVEKAGHLLSELTANEAESLLRTESSSLPLDVQIYLPCAIRAVRYGVKRAHLLSHYIEGVLLAELFTRDGVGTMVTPASLEILRQASIEDIGGILALIAPLEEEGVLVKRGRERLEMEISQYSVLVHDNMIIGCVALHPFPEKNMAELACLAVDPRYQDAGYGDVLLKHIQAQARSMQILRLFVLTTRTAHWFIERGFSPAAITDLPQAKQAFYNYQRRSKVFIKPL